MGTCLATFLPTLSHTQKKKFQRTSVKLKKGINGPALEWKHLSWSSLNVPDAVVVSGDGHSSGAERLFDWNNRPAPLGFTSVTAADGFSPPLPVAPCLHLFPTLFPTSGLLSYHLFLQEHQRYSFPGKTALMCDGWTRPLESMQLTNDAVVGLLVMTVLPLI